MEKNKSIIINRIAVVYFTMIFVAILITGRVLYIQLAQGKMWREKAEKLNLRYDNTEAMRGNILSSDGSLLATSVPIFEIRMDVAAETITDEIFKNQVDSLSFALSNLFNDKSVGEYRKLLSDARADSNRYLLIKRDVTYADLKKLRTFPIFKMGKFKGGLIPIARNKRIYPFRELAYRTIGWSSEEAKKHVGIEGTYTNDLAGMPGKRLMQRIGNGSWRPISSDTEIEPENGADIVTTIDVGIQDVAEAALLRQLMANEADHGCAILMEVKTGEIKAIANLGKSADGTFSEKYNYAIGESTEPGSTFKLASMLVALDKGVTNLNNYVTTGTFQYANRVMRDSHEGGRGMITVKQAFEVSSNVGISQVIYNAFSRKPQEFIDGLYAMGLNQPTGIELRGEGTPQIKNTKNRSWSKVSLPWMSIGYEVAVTPLQTLTLYNAVANNGCKVRPMIIKEIRRSNIPVKVFQPVIMNPAIASKSTIEKAKKLLEGVVENGTAANVKSSIFKIAGKTGTAQIAQGNDGYNKTNYKASFVGYFPADNPKYSCIVVINNPSKGVIYGGWISAPVFLEIAQKVYATTPELHRRPVDTFPSTTSAPKFVAGNKSDLRKVCETLGFKSDLEKIDVEWVKGRGENTAYQFTSTNLKAGVVPDVTGMGIRDAVYLIEKAGYKVRFSGKGKVTRQSAEPGVFMNRGSLIQLELSTKPSKAQIENKLKKEEHVENA